MENAASKLKVQRYGSDPDEVKRYRNDLHYWSNEYGDLHHWGQYEIKENELPAELQEMYKSLWDDVFGVFCYLVEFKGQYGIAFIADYNGHESDGIWSNYCGCRYREYEYVEKVSEELARKLPEIAPNMDAKILLANAPCATGPSKGRVFHGLCRDTEDDNTTELVLFMPYGVTLEDFTMAGNLFDGMAYVWSTPSCILMRGSQLEKTLRKLNTTKSDSKVLVKLYDGRTMYPVDAFYLYIDPDLSEQYSPDMAMVVEESPVKNPVTIKDIIDSIDIIKKNEPGFRHYEVVIYFYQPDPDSPYYDPEYPEGYPVEKISIQDDVVLLECNEFNIYGVLPWHNDIVSPFMIYKKEAYQKYVETADLPF